MLTAIQQNIRRWTAYDTGRMHPFSLAVANVTAPKIRVVNYSKNNEDL
jgi:hypothetical protein